LATFCCNNVDVEEAVEIMQAICCQTNLTYNLLCHNG